MIDQLAPSSRAVFLGVHDYEDLPKLEGVAKNIPALLDQLTDPELEALSVEDCHVLAADSDQNQFYTAVITAAAEASELLLVYYAGHGQFSRDGQDLLLATKQYSDQWDFHAIEYGKLKEYVAGSLARHKVVVIDCCHSGFAVRMGGGDPAEEDGVFDIEGTCVLTSAAETESSLCLPDGSVFTTELVKVLKEGITGPLDPEGRRGEEQSHLLTGDVLQILRNRLANRVEDGKAVPVPRIACRGEGSRIPLARNRAYTGKRPAATTGADRPPGLGLESLGSVIPQENFVGGLGGFEQNLTPECLPYVSPGQDHETERTQLFRRLRESDNRGVLLVGAAGTGKTRTVLEVGRVALDEGWRVLHLRPGGKEPVTSEIIHRVLAEDTPVLVVMDYLNHYFRKAEDDDPPLDLTTLRHQLLPEAHRRGIKVAFIATARPGWLRKMNEIRLYELFDEVDLRQDEEFQRLVAEQALTRLAPTAIERYGVDRMWEICGHRPIIALLVAREVERRVGEGGLGDLTGLRANGELSTWLRNRLEEDDLAVVGSEESRPRPTVFDRVSASELLVAAAAAAAACPQEYDEVVATAKAALPRASEDTPEAEVVVETLLDLGWLQRKGPADTLATAHDIVCDQLVESVILPAGSRSPDRRRTLSLLSGSLTGPRTLGRYATNLARLVNDLAPRPRDAVVELFDRWFADNSSAIGAVMRRDADAGGYALGALVYGPPWAQAAVRNWQEITGPWFEEYGDQADARHLLHSGLSRLPAENAALLVPGALRWLEEYGWRQDASYVLGPLLSRTELPAELSPYLKNAVGWVNLHGQSQGAHFVLSALVARDDLTVQQARKAVPAALQWCEHSIAARQTGTVLQPLLHREDLTAEEAHRVIAAAYAWVGHHITLASSSKVVIALLNYANLPREEVRYAAELALEWLEHHGDTRRANLVLHAVLGMRGVGKPQIRRTVTHAVGWLSPYATEADADFLIGQLLERHDLTPEERENVVGAAERWLEDYATEKHGDFLIHRLLKRDDLTPEERERVVEFGDRWLGTHATEVNASFILAGMLIRPDLTVEQVRLAIGQAMSWLELHRHEDEATYVLQHVLKRKDVPAYEARRAATFANEWLSQYKETKGASYVLSVLLARPDLTDVQAEQAVTLAMSWLSVHGLVDTADRVLRPLLLRTALPPDQVRSAVCRMEQWLEQHREDTSAGYLLGALLARDDLTPEETAVGIEEGLTWLERHCPASGTQSLLPKLLGRAELTPEQSARATAFSQVWERRNTGTRTEAQELRKMLQSRTARTDEEKLRELDSGVRWLEENAPQMEALTVLTAVLEHPMLSLSEPTGKLTERAVTSALAWLGEHWADVTATHLIQRLLRVPEMTDGQLGDVVTYSLRWLARYGEQTRARYVLELLLHRADLDGEQLDAGALLAIGWLRIRGTAPEARHLIKRLLGCPGLVRERVRDTVAFSRSWLAAHRATKEAGFILEALLARDDLTDNEWAWVLPQAMGWLREHGTSRAARHVVTGLAEHDRIGPTDLDELLDTGIAWLESLGHSPQAHLMLRSLFGGPADLNEDQTRRLADCGLRWMSQQKPAKTWRMLGVLAERPDLPADQAAKVESLVSTRVSADPTAVDATFVLEPRLARADVPLAQRTKAISWSLAWLERHMPKWQSRFLLRSLLVLEELSATETHRVVNWSLDWLEHHTDGTVETFTANGAEAVLGPLLSLALDEAQLRRLEVYVPQQEARGGMPSGEVLATVSPTPAIPTSRTSGKVSCPSGVGSGTDDPN
ncbi:caspase, EACC1-associated type [Streptomyces sp. NRRL S-455]|uniref:caspase, EACC1-associated type n=1 Tax=Streptomyces sp. NRRL S-455 TaxID=1463908 RepID=UPI0004C1D7B4|nr:caspase family protein [Streptomyces sp. NRRL S-455]